MASVKVFSAVSKLPLQNEQPFSVSVDPLDRRKLLVTFEKSAPEEKKADDKIEEKQLKVEDLKPSPGRRHRS